MPSLFASPYTRHALLLATAPHPFRTATDESASDPVVSAAAAAEVAAAQAHAQAQAREVPKAPATPEESEHEGSGRSDAAGSDVEGDGDEAAMMAEVRDTPSVLSLRPAPPQAQHHIAHGQLGVRKVPRVRGHTV